MSKICTFSLVSNRIFSLTTYCTEGLQRVCYANAQIICTYYNCNNQLGSVYVYKYNFKSKLCLKEQHLCTICVTKAYEAKVESLILVSKFLPYFYLQ